MSVENCLGRRGARSGIRREQPKRAECVVNRGAHLIIDTHFLHCSGGDVRVWGAGGGIDEGTVPANEQRMVGANIQLAVMQGSNHLQSLWIAGVGEGFDTLADRIEIAGADPRERITSRVGIGGNDREKQGYDNGG